MKESNDALRVDQHVTPALIRVVPAVRRPLTSSELSGVGEPGLGAPHFPATGAQHAVGLVEFARRVDQQRPLDLRLFRVAESKGVQAEGDDAHRYAQAIEFGIAASQLRQVPAAGQSTEVTMKYQQQPPAAVVLGAMPNPARVGEVERDAGLADAACRHHGARSSGRRLFSFANSQPRGTMSRTDLPVAATTARAVW